MHGWHRSSNGVCKTDCLSKPSLRYVAKLMLFHLKILILIWQWNQDGGIITVIIAPFSMHRSVTHFVYMHRLQTQSSGFKHLQNHIGAYLAQWFQTVFVFYLLIITPSNQISLEKLWWGWTLAQGGEYHASKTQIIPRWPWNWYGHKKHHAPVKPDTCAICHLFSENLLSGLDLLFHSYCLGPRVQDQPCSKQCKEALGSIIQSTASLNKRIHSQSCFVLQHSTSNPTNNEIWQIEIIFYIF